MYLECLCLDADLNARFGVVADELMRAVEADPDRSAAELVADVLARWRRLVATKPQHLSEAEIAGLWGELSVLEDLVALDTTAVNAWRGPFKEPHDFRRDQRAIEVKSRIEGPGQFVTINGVEQMAVPANGTLHLWQCKLAASGSGRTLLQLFDSIIARCHLDELVRDGLEAAGISRERFVQYDHARFLRTSVSAYAVTAEFPRITLASFADGLLPPGTSDLNYQLNLGNALPWRLAPEQLGPVMRAFLGG
jgi:hypothetical protein